MEELHPLDTFMEKGGSIAFTESSAQPSLLHDAFQGWFDHTVHAVQGLNGQGVIIRLQSVF